MSEPINIPIVVKDGATKVLKSISSGLDKVKSSANGAVNAFGKQFGKSFDSLKKNGPSILKGIAGGFLAVSAAVGALAFGILQLAKDQHKLQNLREIYKGSPEVLERMRNFAKEAGLEFATAQESMLKLGRAFDPKDAEELLKVIGDIRVKAKLDDSGVANLTDELAELGTKATVGAGDFEKFRKIVGASNFTFEDLAKASGTSIDAIKKQLKDGTLSSGYFAAGLREAGAGIKEVGSTALEGAAGSIDSQLNKIGTIWEDFKANLFESLGGTDRIAEVLGTVSAAMGEILSKKNITAFFDGIAKAVKFVQDNMGILEPLIVGVAGALGAALIPVLIGTATALWGVISAAAVAAAPFIAIGLAIAGVYAIFQNWDSISKAFLGVWDSVIGYIKLLPEKFMSFGSDIMTGLVDGITGSAGRVVDSIKEVANGALKAFTDILQINSPSKVFQEYGDYTAAGYEKGLNQNQGAVEQASGNMAKSAVAGTEEELSNVDELCKSFQNKQPAQANSAGQLFNKQNVTNNNSTTNNSNKPNITLNITIGEGANVDEAALKDSAMSLGNSLIDALSRAGLSGAGY